MYESILGDPKSLAFGAVTGLVFGFLLERGGVARFETIVGQLRLRDHTMLRVMLTAILVGSVGIHAMLSLGWIDGVAIKSAHLLANALGGLTLGVGMAVLGYCPGTGVVAAGAGSRDAWSGLFGMVLGAAAYAELDPWLQTNVLTVGALGKVTLAQELGGAPLAYVAGLVSVGLGVLLLLPRKAAGASAGA
ncbi:MAG: YeeE/YedE thiosulfate transporter family protein [Planctomycetota bacterium]